MLIRCTRQLLKASGVPPDAGDAEPDGLFGEWYATIVSLPFRRGTVVMFTHATTLLCVVARGRVLRTTVPAFRDRLPALLHRLGLSSEWIEEAMGEPTEARFAVTRDRRILGCVNHLAYLLQDDSVFLFPTGSIDLDRLEMRLAGTPMSLYDYHAAAWRLARMAGVPPRFSD